jgi:uncharacterized protein (DUF427 family)
MAAQRHSPRHRRPTGTGLDSAPLVRAVWNGAVIAETDHTVVVEGNHYFPAESVRRPYLVDSPTRSVCPWKGITHYYSLQIGGQVNPDAAWHYPRPSFLARRIKNRIAFWRDVRIEHAPTDQVPTDQEPTERNNR